VLVSCHCYQDWLTRLLGCCRRHDILIGCSEALAWVTTAVANVEEETENGRQAIRLRLRHTLQAVARVRRTAPGPVGNMAAATAMKTLGPTVRKIMGKKNPEVKEFQLEAVLSELEAEEGS